VTGKQGFLIYRGDKNFQPMQVNGVLIVFDSMKTARQFYRRGTDGFGGLPLERLRQYIEEEGLSHFEIVTGKAHGHPLIQAWIAGGGQ